MELCFYQSHRRIVGLQNDHLHHVGKVPELRFSISGVFKEYSMRKSDAYPKPKSGHIDDGARRVLVSQRCARSFAAAENLEHPYPMRDESGPHCNTKRKPSEHCASAFRKAR